MKDQIDEFETYKPKIDAYILQNLHQSRHTYRLPVFIFLYLLSLSLIWGGSTFQVEWNAFLYFPIYLLAAASLHGISLFTHEGVHGVLSQSPAWNRLLSMLCALPVLQNYAAYRVLHLKHHTHLGQPGDPDRYKNYTQWSILEFLMHWGRLIIGYPVYIIAIPILGLQQGNWSDRFWIAIEMMLLMGGVWGILHLNIASEILIHAWLMPMILINFMVNVRGMSQHTLLEEEADLVRGTRSILTHPIVKFFMCNENYHLEHHLYPAVPWYNLPQLHQFIESELRSQQAPFIPSYTSFVREFVMTSFDRLQPLTRP
jgi:fatty acid desaturase